MPNQFTNTDEITHVKNLSKGDVLAFNILFRRYSGRLYRFAYGYLKSETESEELVQEVFAGIWEKRKDLKAELSFKSYLFTISFNIIKKHFRTREYMSGYLHSGFFDEQDMQTYHDISYDSLYLYLTDLVDKLPQRRKEIFVKSRFEGKKIKEIAEELQISHKTIENQLTVTLKYLRTKLKMEDIILVFFFILFNS
jgi:RNA polymerase sigma-70 factor (ECF subfamily)